MLWFFGLRALVRGHLVSRLSMAVDWWDLSQENLFFSSCGRCGHPGRLALGALTKESIDIG